MKRSLLNLIFIVSVLRSAGQKAEYFEFSLLPPAITYAVFDKVEFADNRIVRDYVGTTLRKSDKKLVPLWLHASLPDAMKILIDSAVQNIPKASHTILIDIRNFFITRNEGRFDLHIECYAKWDNEYWLVYDLDSTYKTHNSEINDKVNKVVGSFIDKITRLDLSKNPGRKPRSIEYIGNIDVSEKKEIPIFSVIKPERGVYYTYEEFKNNKPRLKVFNTVVKGDVLKKVLRLPVGDALPRRIPRDSLYAVCDGDHVWLAAPHEYARLSKVGWDFYFLATAYENNQIEEITLAFAFFSIPGAAFAAIPRRAFYEFRLNHLNGKYILLRRAADR